MPRGDLLEVRVTAIGGRGDGLAEAGGERLFVPLAAPGERLRVARAGADRARLVEVLEASPLRVAPPCAHFGDCGGCALQHLDLGWQLEWKRRQVATALSRAGVEAPVAPAVAVPAASRRRAVFAARGGGRRTVLGFNARRAHRIVPVAECHVLRPAIVGLLPPLRRLIAGLPPRPRAFDVHVAELAGGLDVWLAAPFDLDLALRERLAGFAGETGIARLSVGPAPAEVVVQAAAPRVLLEGGIAVPPPPGAFLQASAEAERLLRGQVAAAAAGARRIVDLYAGCGLLTLPLARTAALSLYELDAEAVAAARTVGLPLAAEVRDLARRPLRPEELAKVDIAVLDPPRAGAAPQAMALAASGVPRIVYVSCHPGSFARDARILTEGGYALRQVTPVDQFRWSAHVELIGVFER